MIPLLPKPKKAGAKFLYIDTRTYRGEVIAPDEDGQIEVDGIYFSPVINAPPVLVDGKPVYIITDWSLPRTASVEELSSLGMLQDEYYRRVVIHAINRLLEKERDRLNAQLGVEYFPKQLDYSTPPSTLEDYITMLRRLGYDVTVTVNGRPINIRPSTELSPSPLEKMLVNAEHQVTAGSIIVDDALERIEKAEEGPSWVKWLIIGGAVFFGLFFILPMFLRMIGGMAGQVIHP